MSFNKWKDKEDVVYIIYNRYYSATKGEETMPFAAAGMDPELFILSETNVIWYHLHMEPKIWYKQTYKTETDS